ncbi:MAG TPA: efflux RND transporter periplasmic adaptor subunit [Xanthobacteraceae bacterium]|jgi:RND family efflux transporter MFP subunit|nr:efflux RND transporter periplasmic adaptor subunit [Xanthobacteraceae bacterium]
MSMPISARVAAAFLVFAPLLAGCGNSQQPAAGGAPPAVIATVAKPVKRSIVDQDEYVGRFVAVDSVEVRARLSGYLQSIHFTDGQLVNKGDLLFTIDRRPFQIVLEQARANLAQARANLAFTESDLARGQQLVRDKTITEQTFDQRTQAKRVAEASVAANEALVHQAELDFMEYSELRAPVSGRIGDRRVSPGNLVTGGTGGNTTLLATIMSIDPIRFEFTFDEASYLRYQRLALASGSGTAGGNMSMQVQLKLIDEAGFDHAGHMDFVDNAVSQSTGTVRGRAVFKNDNGIFTPGMFGRIRIQASQPYEALMVPDVAIGTEQDRKFVLVVDHENVARQKYVTLGQVVDGLRIVKQGVDVDDRVIVNNLMRVRPGAKVAPQEQGGPPPQASAAPKTKTD